MEAGDYMAIRGASGCGKSTLLNLMGLLDVPSAGSLRLWGREVAGIPEDEAAHLRASAIGFIFQTFNLLSYLTVEENIALPLGYSQHRESESVTRTLLQRVKLEHRAGAFPATLSGGERQRVAIARALANQPSMILADEPTGSLDSKNGAIVMDLIEELHNSGTTVLIVTHDEKIARRARRIVHMQDGRIL